MENERQSTEERTIFVAILTAVTLGGWWIVYLLHKRKHSDSIATERPSESIQIVCEPQPRRDRAAFVASLAAVVGALVAVAALYVEIQEVQQMRAEIAEMQQYNRLFAVPRLGFERVMAPTSDHPNPGLFLVNRGQGLAILKTYRVYINDK